MIESLQPYPDLLVADVDCHSLFPFRSVSTDQVLLFILSA